ncbi:chromate efflux transporter [Ningiella sp. W23]|uniref:chromate efflux transporter n=1 Tax=Ningiella sp. W23 TaxID=3023715 RepID=UPI00375818E4
MSLLNIFWIFLRLGCTSFGGPIAHLMYFRKRFVEQYHWLSEQEYARLLTLCQTLPGPASSQVGFAIGMHKGGLIGGILAFVGFTAPTVILLVAFANYLYLFSGEYGQAVIGGLMILSFVVVSQGLVGMCKSLSSTFLLAGISMLSFVLLVVLPSVWMQLSVIIGGAVIHFAIVQARAANTATKETTHSTVRDEQVMGRPFMAWFALAGFIALFVLLPFISIQADSFYRSGALVFGGGHVVLPLLEQNLADAAMISQADFLAGYGATQAMPGPMFGFAAYLGFISEQNGAYLGAIIATVCIFLPGFLLLIAALPYWNILCTKPRFNALIAGANAAVVGLLAAALYDPIITHALKTLPDVLIALVALTAAWRFKVHVLLVAGGCVLLKLLVLFI